jgi:hypothetical protein
MSVISMSVASAPSQPCGFWSGPRSRRVAVLLIGILILSLADLLLTLSHMRTIGMAEANPLAVWIVKETGSAAVLSAFKIVTVALSCGLLFLCRHTRSSEAACWFALGILVALAIAWHRYSAVVATVDPVLFVHMPGETQWISLP